MISSTRFVRRMSARLSNQPINGEDKSMHTRIIRDVLIGLALSVLVAANSAAVAETITYKAVLNAQNQPTPNDSKGTGTAEVTYDSTSKTLTWTINFDGLTGPSTMAHFAGPAAPAANTPLAPLLPPNPT